MFVVAASHLIFRLRHPSHALITMRTGQSVSNRGHGGWGRRAYPSAACGGCARQRIHNLKIQSGRSKPERESSALGALFCVSRGCCWYAGGAKEKVPIWELWGRRRRATGSLDMLEVSLATCTDAQGGGGTIRDGRWRLHIQVIGCI